MIYDIFTIQEPGEPESWAHPTLNDDLSIRMDSIDGNLVGPILASELVDNIKDNRRGKWEEDSWMRDTEIWCLLTESRIAFVCPRYDKGGGWSGIGLGLAASVVANAVSKSRAAKRSRGTALVGQLRYAWIWSIQFWNKRGWGSSETLHLYYRDPEGMSRFLQLFFNKREDAAAIAHILMQRIVAYRLAEKRDMDEETNSQLSELLAAGPPVAVNGRFSDYDIPGDYFVAGRGEEFAPVAPPSQLKHI